MDNVPIYILTIILQQASADDILSARLVCRAWKKLADEIIEKRKKARLSKIFHWHGKLLDSYGLPRINETESWVVNYVFNKDSGCFIDTAKDAPWENSKFRLGRGCSEYFIGSYIKDILHDYGINGSGSNVFIARVELFHVMCNVYIGAKKGLQSADKDVVAKSEREMKRCLYSIKQFAKKYRGIIGAIHKVSPNYFRDMDIDEDGPVLKFMQEAIKYFPPH